ncbi:MAG: FAD binding domain-containing protein [Anaerolineales bacterium]|nr:FAD binding domain-containing protein [Anaerolineales bacterium]
MDDGKAHKMTPIEYERPDSLEQALRLLPQGQPLGGGTALAPQRRELALVIDLQGLPLDQLSVDEGGIRLGATLKLQALVESAPRLPAALVLAAGLEAPLNLRNMATVAGTIVACDGRSPLVAVLLAMEAAARLAPGDSAVPLDSLLDARPEGLSGRLITSIDLRPVVRLQYEQVARSPKDRPIVCAALGRLLGEAGQTEYRLVLGGHGSRPARVLRAEQALQGGDLEAAGAAAAAAYAEAGDAWASSAYRSHVAAVLTRRLAQAVAR